MGAEERAVLREVHRVIGQFLSDNRHLSQDLIPPGSKEKELFDRIIMNEGLIQKDLAKLLGVSSPTLSKRKTK